MSASGWRERRQLTRRSEDVRDVLEAIGAQEMRRSARREASQRFFSVDPILGAPADLPLRFSITVELRRDAVKIAPSGELDLATIGQLQRELGELIGAGFARVVIDLRDVEFLDSSALHALLDAYAEA
jgi:hypothetical protein